MAVVGGLRCAVSKVVVQIARRIDVCNHLMRHPEFRFDSAININQPRVNLRNKRTSRFIGENLFRIDGFALFRVPGGVFDMRTVAAGDRS